MTLRRAQPTIHDVAREAGVSIGTVSKVLNKTGTIAPDTRKRVTEVAERLQFRPNTLAQSLHSGLSGSIGLISNDSFGRFTMPIMEGLEGVLAPLGIGVFMCNATDDPAREARACGTADGQAGGRASSSPPGGPTAAPRRSCEALACR